MQQHTLTGLAFTEEEVDWLNRLLAVGITRLEEEHRRYLGFVMAIEWDASRDRDLDVLKTIRRKLRVQSPSVPQCTLSLVNDEAWMLYENCYIDFSRFDQQGCNSERLSHFVDWKRESYPQSELELLEVMVRALERFLDAED